MLTNASIQVVDQGTFKGQKYCLEIENENRKYVLSTKSQYDLNQWFWAIKGQILLAQDNGYIADINRFISQREEDGAKRDMALIQRIFKPKNIVNNPVQPILLSFINDHFISELLPNLTQYQSLASQPEYQRQALEKAKDLVQHLRTLNIKISKTAVTRKSDAQAPLDGEGPVAEAVAPDYKKYRDLKPEQRI
jgi:hypothetical protein